MSRLGAAAATIIASLLTTTAGPAWSDFDTSYTSRGRAWIAEAPANLPGLPATPYVLAAPALGTGDCSRWTSYPDDPSWTRDSRLSDFDAPLPMRDCRFEQLIADAIGRSGVFRDFTVGPVDPTSVDLVLLPERTIPRVDSRTLPAFQWLSVATGMILPLITVPLGLPFAEHDEAYDVVLAVYDADTQRLFEVSVQTSQSHLLGWYSCERRFPKELAATLGTLALDHDHVEICRGRGSHEAIRQVVSALADGAIVHGDTATEMQVGQ